MDRHTLERGAKGRFFFFICNPSATWNLAGQQFKSLKAGSGLCGFRHNRSRRHLNLRNFGDGLPGSVPGDCCNAVRTESRPVLIVGDDDGCLAVS